MPAPAAALRPFDPESDEGTGAGAGRALVAFGFRGLYQWLSQDILLRDTMGLGVVVPVNDLEHSVRGEVVSRCNTGSVDEKVIDRLRHCRGYFIQSHDFGIVLEFRRVVDFSLSNAVLENAEKVFLR